jgi:uncharacterized protein
MLGSRARMPPPVDLPPVPEHPELPPEVTIPGESEIVFRTEDGVLIEARAHLPARCERAILLCHPHPLYGGTLHNAIIVSVAKRLLEPEPSRVGWLRLNFRGVGRSEGRYGNGVDEVFDAVAAFAEMRRQVPKAKLALVGYSFGASVGYRAAVRAQNIDRISLVAPLLRKFAEWSGEYTGPLQIVAASRDQFASMEETNELARRLGASVEFIDGAEHFFIRFRREVAGRITRFIAPELVT